MDSTNKSAPGERGAGELRISDCGTDYTTRNVRIGMRYVRFYYDEVDREVREVRDPSPPKRLGPDELSRYNAALDSFTAQVDKELAAEILLAARAAGVECVMEEGLLRLHGEADLVAAWAPALYPHGAAIVTLLAAKPRRRS